MIQKIKEFFKLNWKFLIFLVCFYGVMTYELPYVVYTPGGSINMSERVSGDNTYSEEGSLSMTYVSMVRGSLPFLALSYIIPNWDIVATENITYDGDDLEETVAIDKIYMQEAISNAEYVAYSKSGITFTETKVHHTVTYIAENAKTNLKYGDEIVKVGGNDFVSLKNLQEYISTKEVGDTITIEYIRNDKTYTESVTLIEIDGEPKAGISIASISDYETEYNIEVKTKSSESGPSGGLITALAIYNQITKDDLTQGLTIMGTGTIDKDGTVGEIGGIKYKLIGAYKDGADVFICPEENYEEAKKVAEDNGYDIIVLSASTFDEALEKIKNIKA